MLSTWARSISGGTAALIRMPARSASTGAASASATPELVARVVLLLCKARHLRIEPRERRLMRLRRLRCGDFLRAQARELGGEALGLLIGLDLLLAARFGSLLHRLELGLRRLVAPGRNAEKSCREQQHGGLAQSLRPEHAR